MYTIGVKQCQTSFDAGDSSRNLGERRKIILWSTEIFCALVEEGAMVGPDGLDNPIFQGMP